MKKIIINLWITLVLVLLVNGLSFAAVEVGGELKAGTSCGINDGDIYRNLLQADLDLQKAFGNTELRIILRGEHDSIRPESESEYFRKYETGQSRFYIREGYVNHTVMFNKGIDSINFKLGRIIYTWGVSDEIKPVDIINPQDYSNMFYTLIQDRKYGVISGNASIYFTENIFLEMVAVPEVNPSELGTNRFTSSQSLLISTMEAGDVDGTPASTDSIVRDIPAASVKNSAYAARFGFTIFDVDGHINYYYGFDNLPAIETRAVAANDYNFTTTYKKIQMVGIDFQRALVAGIALRGEAAWFYTGKYFALSNDGAGLTPFQLDLAGGGTGLKEKQYVEYTFGFDDHDFFIKNLYFNLQFNQRIIIGYKDSLGDDQLRHMLLFVLRYSFYNSKAVVGTRGIYDIGGASAMINLEVSYKFADNFKLAAGAWFVEGDNDTDLGQFHDNDIVYVSGTLSF